MTILRLVAFGIGMGFTALVVFLFRHDAAPHLAIVSPSTGKLLPALTVVSPLHNPLTLTERFLWGLVAAWLATVLLSLILAHKLGRSKSMWTLSVAVFPFLAPQLLACLNPLSREAITAPVFRLAAVLCGSCTILAAAYAIDRGALANAVEKIGQDRSVQELQHQAEAPEGGEKPGLSWLERCLRFLDEWENWCRRNVVPVGAAISQDRDLIRLCGVWLSAVVATCLLSRALRRGVVDWTSFAFVCPFLAPMILAALGRAEKRQGSRATLNNLSFLSGLILFAAVVAACIAPGAVPKVFSSPSGISILAATWVLAIFSATTTAILKGCGFWRSAALAAALPWMYPMVVALQEQVVRLKQAPISGFWRILWLRYLGLVSFGKRCSACRKSVPIWSRAGQYCPHCGVYWSAEVQIPGSFLK